MSRLIRIVANLFNPQPQASPIVAQAFGRVAGATPLTPLYPYTSDVTIHLDLAAANALVGPLNALIEYAHFFPAREREAIEALWVEAVGLLS